MQANHSWPRIDHGLRVAFDRQFDFPFAKPERCRPLSNKGVWRGFVYDFREASCLALSKSFGNTI